MSAPEFDGQPMTKREVLIARRGYTVGYEDACATRLANPVGRYPLPKVTRPRVTLDPHDSGTSANPWHWKVERHAVVLCDARGAVFTPPCQPGISSERVALWADLLANPTEEVDA